MTLHRTVLPIAILFSVTSLAAAQTPAAPTAAEEAVVVASGDSVITVAPDRAWITIAAESRAGNPRDAQKRNAEAMNPVLDRLRAAGIPADAIRTVGYDLQQEFDFVNNRRVSRGYVARNTVDVRVDTLDKLADLLDAAVQAGATSVNGLRFDLKDRAKLERDALRLAATDARARAQALAAGAGATITRVVRVEEQGVASPPMPLRTFAAAEAKSADAPAIAAGQIEIRAHVTLTAAVK